MEVISYMRDAFVMFSHSDYFMSEVFPYWVAFVVSPIIMNFIVRRMYR